MSSDLPRITQLGKDQVRVRLESKTISPITHANLSGELRVYGLCWVEVIRATSTRGGGGWCQVALTRVPVFLGQMGVAVEGLLGDMGRVAGDKSRGWAQWDQTQVLAVGGCSYLSQKPGSHSFIHSFIHPFLEKYTKHRITQADHLFPRQVGSQSVISGPAVLSASLGLVRPSCLGPRH